MANDSILTRDDVESLLRHNTMRGSAWQFSVEACNTITQAVELLERMANLYPYRIEFVNDPNCCEQCKAKRNAQQWLACYHAADSSPQSQPSPPQK